jgi:hypothetical protein
MGTPAMGTPAIGTPIICIGMPAVGEKVGGAPMPPADPLLISLRVRRRKPAWEARMQV